jgi:formimidoylglutamate deiminase
MTRQYLLDSVLLPQGWSRGVLVSVADDGYISAIESRSAPAPLGPEAQPAPVAAELASLEHVAGITIPGMPNAHSHAFQRGMVGNTEFRLSSRDSFWTWRRAMYALANRIKPDELQTLATQLFIEMLKAGYTSVAEFHYLHRTPEGQLYPTGTRLWDAVIAAAEAAGIGLTLLPTLYQTSDFGAKPLNPEQARFALDTDWFLRAIADRVRLERLGASTLRTGAAFHSLRAVPVATLTEAAQALRQIDHTLPLHIHIAEQVKEVDSCIEVTGQRPIELLLDTGLLDPHWCLVHATHATAAELKGIASSGATVCVSNSTEANLGDGFFDAARFLKFGGHLCVGSDSQSTVNPSEELRWMEYQARLRKKRRGVLADTLEPHVGTRLWREAAEHGARAIGQPAGALAVGRRADWLVLDDTHASMAGAAPNTAIDHLIFAGGSNAIRGVMVGGRWVVRDFLHGAEAPLRPRFLALMSELAAST